MPTYLDLFRQDYDALVSNYARYMPPGKAIPAYDTLWTNLPTVVDAVDGLGALLTKPPVDVDAVLKCLKGSMLARPYYDKYTVLLAAHARAVLPLVARMYFLAKSAQK